MAENSRLRLRQIHQGDVFVLHNPERIGKVVDDTEVEVIDRSGERARAEIKDAVVVMITLAVKPIKGLITERTALVNTSLLKSLMSSPGDEEPSGDRELLEASMEDDEISTGFWEEVWTERLVHSVVPLKADPRARAAEGPFISQVYCHEERKISRRQHSSSARYHTITGERVPPEAVPVGIFPGGVVAPDEKSDAPVSGFADMSWNDLRAFAKSKGVQVYGKKREEVEAELESAA